MLSWVEHENSFITSGPGDSVWSKSMPRTITMQCFTLAAITAAEKHTLLGNFLCHSHWTITCIVGLELAIDPPPPRGNFVHYNFLKLHYIRHKIKDVSPLRVAALTCNITLYTLPPEIALNVPDNVSTMTCSYIFACWHRFMNFL